MATTISPAISIKYLQQIFGVSDTDLGKLLEHVCSDVNIINIWAKFKPIYHSGVGLLTNAMRQDNSHIISGYNISWGLMKPTSNSWNDFIDTTTGVVKNGLWGYDKPVGSSASPWRMSDFAEIDNNGNATGNRYSSDAKCPIQIVLTQNDELPVPKTTTEESSTLMFLFTFQNGIAGWSSAHSLSIDEIFAAEKTYYPTVIMTCFYGGKIYEYSKSGDYPVSHYVGNVDPVVQVPVETKTLADSVAHDGGSYNTGALADGSKWTACMVLTSQKIEGSTATHTINSAAITRLEFSLGVDRKQLTVKNTTSLDSIISMSYLIKLKRSLDNYSYYYVESISVTINTRFTGGALSFNIDASFSCLIGVIGGNGWAGSNQSETRKNWASLYLDISEQGKEVTKILSPSTGLPIFKFSKSLPDGSRIAAGSLSFKSGGNYLSGNFSIQVQGGATEYEANILVKNT